MSTKMKVFKLFLFATLFAVIVGVSTVAGIFVYFSKDLPKLDRLSDYKPKVKTKIYSADNELIGEYYVENRELVDINEVPQVMINAIIAAEDKTFFEHKGIDFKGILRAAKANLLAGKVVQGASTITQQVAKTFLLSSERKFNRKIKEAILASRIEEKFTKNEILHLYLNQIFFGHNSFGIKVAARNYFDKDVKDISIAEAALLAALPKAPSSNSPFKNPTKARTRQLYVLRRLKEEGFINKNEYEIAKNFELKLKPYEDVTREKTPYFTEHVRRYLKSKYGDDAVYKDGLTVFTTVNYRLQKAAQAAIKKGIVDLDRRQGYRGAVRHLLDEEIEFFIEATSDDGSLSTIELGKVYKDSAVVTKVDDKAGTITVQLANFISDIPVEDFKWARTPDPQVPFYSPLVAIEHPSEVFKRGDVIDVKVIPPPEKKNEDAAVTEDDSADKPEFAFSLYQEPLGQAALVSMNAHTGFVDVMVGGYDFDTSEFNRAVQAKRLPGSAFKPVIYAAALDSEPKDGKYYTPATMIYDTALVFDNGKWKPSNYGKKFKGAISLRKALAKSVNIPAVKVLSDIGVNYVRDYAKALGINAYINPDPTAALGSSAMTLLDLSNVYGIFASGGLKIEPVFVTKVLDRDGNVLEEYVPFEGVIEEELNDEDATTEEEALEPEDPRRVMSASTAYLMTSLLQSVVQEGTGWRVKKAFGKRPMAGKTGTTNNYIDAWFMGFSPDIVTGAWVGFDEERSLGQSETGSRSAAPIWVDYMKVALKDKPVTNFRVPDDIEFIKIDPATGLLAKPMTKNAKFECFKKGTVPTEYTTTEDENKPDDFFITDLEEEKDYKKSKRSVKNGGFVDEVIHTGTGGEEEILPLIIP